MDKLKTKVSSARNRVAERTSRGTGSASLSVPQSTLPPEDNASTTAVNEGFLGPQLGTSAHDFATPAAEPTPRPAVEPPTSLESSVDAGQSVPAPPKKTEQPVRPGLSATQRATSQANGRRRSNSAPNRPSGFRQPSIGLVRQQRNGQLQTNTPVPSGTATPLARTTSRLPVLDETCVLEHARSADDAPQPRSCASSDNTDNECTQRPGRLRKASIAIQKTLGLGGNKDGTDSPRPGTSERAPAGNPCSASMVDVLDTLDAEVQTITSLTNVQNSLFIPNLGRFVNRNPTYVLRPTQSEAQSLEEIHKILEPARQAQTETQQDQADPKLKRTESQTTMATVATIDSQLSESRFAVLPHGTSLEGWSKEDKAELNDHVRHMLHSRRSKFKRAMRGFGQYVRRPLGFLVTLYATLITLFGLAWVLFLIGWINVGGQQIYVVHIIDSVLVALFAIVGDGLAPFRAVDTYHMIYIAHYHHYTWSRRKKDRLPKLHDHNDLPSSNAPITGPMNPDPDDPEKQWEFTVLTPKQQAKLEYHQAKFSKSHSFYKPHETETHYAFPLRLLIAIVVLLDCHSLFQIALGACTWGIYYKVRPFALTTVILCCSITCNATAGLLILIGDKKTRKKDVLERMNRQELTEMAIQKVEKKRGRESESEDEAGVGSSRAGRGKKSMDAGRRSLDVFRFSRDKEREKDKVKLTDKEKEKLGSTSASTSPSSSPTGAKGTSGLVAADAKVADEKVLDEKKAYS